MDMFVRNGYVTLRMPKNGGFFLRKFISADRFMYEGRKAIGEVYCRSNGWLRIVGNVKRIAAMIRIAYRRYRLARDAEIRARLLIATGKATLVAATQNGPFLTLSLMEVASLPDRIKRLAYNWGAKCR